VCCSDQRLLTCLCDDQPSHEQPYPPAGVTPEGPAHLLELPSDALGPLSSRLLPATTLSGSFWKPRGRWQLCTAPSGPHRGPQTRGCRGTSPSRQQQQAPCAFHGDADDTWKKPVVPKWPRAWVPAPVVAPLRWGNSRPAAHTGDLPSGREGGGTWCLLGGESRCPGHCAHPPHPPFLPKGSSLQCPRANCHASRLSPGTGPPRVRSRSASAQPQRDTGTGSACSSEPDSHRDVLRKQQQLFQEVHVSQATELGPAWTRLPRPASGRTGTSHHAGCRRPWGLGPSPQWPAWSSSQDWS